MKKKTWLIILAVFCFLAGIAFALIGIRQSLGAASYSDLRALGELTFEAYAGVQEEDGSYTIYYRSVDNENGVHTYERYDVGQEEYDSFRFDIAVADSEPDAEQLPKSTIKRYVYTYRKDGEQVDAVYDTYKTLYDVSQQIESANTVAPVRFYVFSGLLILTGVYVLIVALTRKKKQKQEA